MDTMILTDTAHTIEQEVAEMEQVDASCRAIGDEYATRARALLATVRHLMTGYEMDQCENATGDYDDPDGFDCCVIDRLTNQFSKEISEWITR